MWAFQGWELNFRRNLNDWEIPRLIKFFKILEAFQGLKNGVDRLWWNGHKQRGIQSKFRVQTSELDSGTELHMAMETNLENQSTFEGGMFLMAASKRSCLDT
uniref:Putative ovule protein n=1 Tax=Solanum chacoense TaxID=4108 RepID=A0A0V0ID10_SOLCH